MTRNKLKIQRLTLAAFFVAIEVLMGFTPIGYIPLGALNITTMHLPVLLAGILVGPSFGAGMGFVFGLTSMIHATLMPGITSFVLSPFVTVAGIGGNFFSLLICFVPRILLGWLSGMMYSLLKKRIQNQILCSCVVAVINTVIHTILVLSGIVVFFGPQYASALGTDMNGILVILLGTITSNMIFEAILAGVAIPALVSVLAHPMERMDMVYGKTN